MRLSCLQENLNRGLGIVGRAVAARTTLPITNNILLSTDQSRLKLSATNLEIAISCWIGAKVEEEGAITIPARLLIDFVNSLPAERIDMSLAPRGRRLQIRCARFEAQVSGVDADEFPPIPEVGDEPLARLDPAALRTAIAQVEFAAAADDSRPVLTGIHCNFEGDELTLAAADGFRLAVHRAPLLSPIAEAMAVVIPARALHEVGRLLADRDEPVDVVINPSRSQVLFHLKDVDVVSQLLQGAFPNYSQLIPSESATRVVVDRSAFLQATRAASIFAKDGSGIVRIQATPGSETSPGKMAVIARAEEVGENFGEIDAAVIGEAAKIAFNGRYLLDVLGVIDTGQVAVEINSPSSPGVIKPVGAENYVHVVMPMFVQW